MSGSGLFEPKIVQALADNYTEIMGTAKTARLHDELFAVQVGDTLGCSNCREI